MNANTILAMAAATDATENFVTDEVILEQHRFERVAQRIKSRATKMVDKMIERGEDRFFFRN